MNRRARPWLLGLGAVAVVGAVTTAALARKEPPPIPPAPLAAGYAGTETCARCHSDVAALHAESGHAKTLARASEGVGRALRPSGWVRDPVLPLESRVVRRGRTIGAEATAGDLVRWQPADWAFGSGKHGVTLVARMGVGRYAELPISYYPRDGWDLTPGHLAFPPYRRMYHPAGVPEEHVLFYECFNCHATSVASGKEDLDLTHMRTGVQCERCHGPGEAHVRAAEAGESLKGTIRNPRLTSPRQVALLCGECHRAELPPNVKPDAKEAARFAPAGLLRSRCFRESGERLSCSDCHNPHQDASFLEPSYERVCGSCHTPGERQAVALKTRPCPVNPREGCVGCHMPKLEAASHSYFTDHWIRVRQEKPGEPPKSPPAPPARPKRTPVSEH